MYFKPVFCILLILFISPFADAGEIKDATHWMRNSAERKALFHQVYRLAGEKLEKLVRGKSRGTWAVSLDADETIIDNSLYNAERERMGGRFSSETWKRWSERRKAKVLPGVKRFLQKVRALGGKIAIVTNRRFDKREDTKAVFQAEGIPYDILLLRTRSREKEGRWQQIQEGTASPGQPPLEIVMWIGDNIGDFPNLTQSHRFEGPDPFKDFGERYFVLPNPMYGSWWRNPRQ